MAESQDVTAAMYYQEVGRFKLPTAAQEKALFLAYKRAEQLESLGKSAAERKKAEVDKIRLGKEIAQGYLRFVILQARKRTQDPQLLKDLISLGNVGLMIAIRRFDPERGTRFLTFGASWIVVYMQDQLGKRSVVHVPNHTRKENRRKRNAEDILIAKGELATSSYSEPTVATIENFQIAADDDTEQESSAYQRDVFTFMKEAELSRTERLILTYTYGLCGTDFDEDAMIQFLYEFDGSLFSIPKLRRVQAEATQKLRSLMESKGIDSMSDLM